ncbi:hypothetical protein [Pseudomonas saudimassiliensis]|uniref:hypothetical protein n=1 Tax=Pseudomonas saudimassiliensis TaxID=1461581 RepID=UPI000B2AA9C4|nr:hypothetical protein [Pseudomonas saudimassiliensis]
MEPTKDNNQGADAPATDSTTPPLASPSSGGASAGPDKPAAGQETIAAQFG